MKRLSVLFSVLIVAAMLLGACAPAAATEAPAAPAAATEAPAAPAAATEAPAAPAAPAAGKTVLNVWSFTNEIMTMAVAFE